MAAALRASRKEGRSAAAGLVDRLGYWCRAGRFRGRDGGVRTPKGVVCERGSREDEHRAGRLGKQLVERHPDRLRAGHEQGRTRRAGIARGGGNRVESGRDESPGTLLHSTFMASVRDQARPLEEPRLRRKARAAEHQERHVRLLEEQAQRGTDRGRLLGLRTARADDQELCGPERGQGHQPLHAIAALQGDVRLDVPGSQLHRQLVEPRPKLVQLTGATFARLLDHVDQRRGPHPPRSEWTRSRNA